MTLSVTPQDDPPIVSDFGLDLTRAQDYYAQSHVQANISAAVNDSAQKVKRARELLTLGAGVILLIALERILDNHGKAKWKKSAGRDLAGPIIGAAARGG
jgi:hypothetical protein